MIMRTDARVPRHAARTAHAPGTRGRSEALVPQRAARRAVQ
jgi:hypothetical protein